MQLLDGAAVQLWHCTNSTQICVLELYLAPQATVPIREVQQGTFEREFQLVAIKEPERTVATIKVRATPYTAYQANPPLLNVSLRQTLSMGLALLGAGYQGQGFSIVMTLPGGWTGDHVHACVVVWYKACPCACMGWLSQRGMRAQALVSYEWLMGTADEGSYLGPSRVLINRRRMRGGPKATLEFISQVNHWMLSHDNVWPPSGALPPGVQEPPLSPCHARPCMRLQKHAAFSGCTVWLPERATWLHL